MIDVSIIIINYKKAEMTYNAIKSIIDNSNHFSYEIIVVDNSNDEEEFNHLSKLVGDNANIVNPKSNLGFGGANNLGASVSKGRYLYFINNDTLLLNNSIYELFKAMENDENIGIVGSNLFDSDEKPNHSFIPYEKNYRSDKRSASVLRILLAKVRKRRSDFNYSHDPMKIEGYVCGASLFIRKDLFDKLNGFSKDIFMYAEDALICYRLIHELHKEIYNIPTSKIIHYEGISLDNDINPFRADNIINGNSVYYKTIFGNKMCLKYLKMMAKKCHQYALVKRLMHKDYRGNVMYMEKYYEKYNEMKGKEE